MISLILKFGFVIANSASYETRKSRWICSTLRFVLGLVRAPPRGGEPEAEEAAIKFDSCQPRGLSPGRALDAPVMDIVS